MSVAEARRAAWDDAVLVLLYERGESDGEELLAAIIVEATDAVARLKERGLIEVAS